jgi:zinc protease
MTAPRRDEAAFRSFMSKMEAFLANRAARPEAVFQDRMGVALSQGHFRRRPPSPELLREVDLDRALRVYRERFADISDFTFLLVGAFDPETVRPLVATYLGGLPGSGRRETWRDVGVEPPPGVVEVEVEMGIEPKSQVRIVFHGEAPFSREGVHEIGSLADVLRIRLREVLREDLGGVYGVSVGGSLGDRPRQRYSFSIALGCAPESVDSLVAATFAEIAALRDRGPEESYLQRVRETQRRERETDLRENGFWLDSLEFYLSRDLDPRLILRYDELIARETAENVQAAARKYLDPGRYVKGVLRPAPAPPPTPAPGR